MAEPRIKEGHLWRHIHEGAGCARQAVQLFLLYAVHIFQGEQRACRQVRLHAEAACVICVYAA